MEVVQDGDDADALKPVIFMRHVHMNINKLTENALKNGDDGDRGDPADNNFAELGEKSEGFAEFAEGENNEDGENREEVKE